MTFGPYQESHLFKIESSKTYKNIKHEGVKIAEFLLLKEKEHSKCDILIVEAKENTPNPTSCRTLHDIKFEAIEKEMTGGFENLGAIKACLAKLERDAYFNDIREKFMNSLLLFLALYSQRHPDNSLDLPDVFRKIEIFNVNFQLVLVVKDSEEEWLPPLNEKVKKLLNPIVKIWNLSPQNIIVLNEKGAKNHGLIT